MSDRERAQKIVDELKGRIEPEVKLTCPKCGAGGGKTLQMEVEAALAKLHIEDGDVIFYDANLIERRAFAAVKNIHIITLVPVQPIIPHDPVANAVHKMSAKQLKALLEG